MRTEKILLAIFIFFVSAFSVYSQSLEETFQKGKKAFYADNFDESSKCFNQILAIEKVDYKTCLYKGLVYEMNFDNDKAVTELTKAIEINPEKSDAYFYRGKIYDKLEKYPEALNDYTMAIKYDKKNSELYFNRASINQGLGNTQDAIKDYSNSIKLNPKDDIAFYNRGLLYMELKENQKAINDFESAILIDKMWERELKKKIDLIKSGK